jgi:oxalyl-CoA decarboxylase
MSTETQDRETTDGFHLVTDALKLNDIDTIFAPARHSITDSCAWRRSTA